MTAAESATAEAESATVPTTGSASRVLAVIPARLQSTRLPRKPLLELAGEPLIAHVVRRVRATPAVTETLVATDDARIAEAAQRAGARALISDEPHQSGTDRVAAAARREADAGRHWAWILNVQGDEPLIHPTDLAGLINGMRARPSAEMGTLIHPISQQQAHSNPHLVKVVLTAEHKALYFSRAPIPYRRSPNETHNQAHSWDHCWQHLGVYLFRAAFLQHFAQLPITPLAQLEQLEQLRALEHGHTIHCFVAAHPSLGVDTPEDLAEVRATLQNDPANKPAGG